LEPMHRLWRVLADAAGEERRINGLTEGEDKWIEMEGTVIRESISERRKFWFQIVSRATNTKNAGSVTLLPWVWEREDGNKRFRIAFEQKLEKISEIPRISEETTQKLIAKVKADALLAGVNLDADDDAKEDDTKPGVPNWEIEELKSISDGHVLLQAPAPEADYSWIVNPYKSLPRIGMDALHPALISVDAHKVRLRMMQGRDRADILQDTFGAELTLGVKDRLQLRHVELMLQQTAGRPLTVEEEVARLVVANSPNASAIAGADCKADALLCLATRLLDSEVGKQLKSDLKDSWTFPEERGPLLTGEVSSWKSLAP